jgi:DNA-binding transcriptional regulator YhcF (GntR family)
MTKKEAIWREILRRAIEDNQIEFTQKELAEKFHVSTSTVFNALKNLRETGAVEVSGRNFSVRDTEKFLYLFATKKNFKKNIAYKTSVAASAPEIEGKMPGGAIFTAYSAFVKKYKDAPADYDKVYVYADEKTLAEIKERFPKKRGRENLFVLKMDPVIRNSLELTSDIEIFSDLWNLEDWYAKDFLEALKQKIFKFS